MLSSLEENNTLFHIWRVFIQFVVVVLTLHLAFQSSLPKMFLTKLFVFPSASEYASVTPLDGIQVTCDSWRKIVRQTARQTFRQISVLWSCIQIKIQAYLAQSVNQSMVRFLCLFLAIGFAFHGFSRIFEKLTLFWVLA